MEPSGRNLSVTNIRRAAQLLDGFVIGQPEDAAVPLVVGHSDYPFRASEVAGDTSARPEANEILLDEVTQAPSLRGKLSRPDGTPASTRAPRRWLRRQRVHPAHIPHEAAASSRPAPQIPATPALERPARAANPRRSPLSAEAP
jgi:hypothetical protein